MAYKIEIKEKGKGGVSYGRIENTKMEVAEYIRDAKKISKREGYKITVKVTEIKSKDYGVLGYNPNF